LFITSFVNSVLFVCDLYSDTQFVQCWLACSCVLTFVQLAYHPVWQKCAGSHCKNRCVCTNTE